jgi:hypothetical protein
MEDELKLMDQARADMKAYDAAKARLIAAIETKRKTGSVRTWKKLGAALDVGWSNWPEANRFRSGCARQTWRASLHREPRVRLIIDNPLMP